MAGSGNGPLLSAFLDSELDGVGSVRGFLGESKAMTLQNHATTVFDGKQRQRIDDEALPWYESASSGTLNEDKFLAWATGDANKKYVSSSTTHSILQANRSALAHQQREFEKSQMVGAVEASEADARRSVLAAVREGNLWQVQGTRNPKVLTMTGETKDFNVKDFAEQALVQMTARLSFDQQVAAWSLNGLDNPDWRNRLQAGFFNLAAIGMDTSGKPVGQLNAAGKESIKLFGGLEDAAPDYAKNLLGEKTYSRFSNIAFLVQNGRSAEEAAAIAANADSGAIVGSDTDKLVKKVHAEVRRLTNDPWYKADWVQSLMGDNTSVNTLQVTGTVRRYATLLAHSGQYGDADAAIAQAAKYMADPKVTAKVNGTLYMRSEMPQGPKSRTQDEWFERYIDEAVKPIAKQSNANPNEVRLEYDPITKAYRPFVRDLPMLDSTGTVMVVPKIKIEDWYRTTEAQDVDKAVQRGKETQFKASYESYRKRVWGSAGAAQRDGGAYVIEKYDPSQNRAKLERQILSEDAFRRITADGNQDKSLGELMKLYP